MIDTSQKKILLVESDINIATHEKEIIEKNGYFVIHVYTCEIAVEAVDSSPDINLVLMDIDYPEGMDGMKAAGMIMENYNIPVIILSSFMNNDIIKTIESISKYGYIDKNSGETALISSIKTALWFFNTKCELQKSEERYRRLVEGSPNVLYIFSSKRGGVYYSPQVEQVLGYSLNFLYDHPFHWNDSIYADDRNLVLKAIREFDNGKHFDIEYRIKDVNGNWKWLQERSINRVVGDNEVLIEGVVTDITDRKQTEMLLWQDELKYKELFEKSIKGFLIIDRHGKYLMSSEKVSQQFGLQNEDVIGKSMFDLLPKQVAQKYFEENAMLIDSGGCREYEDTFILNGKKKTFLISDQCLQDANGCNYAILSSSVEITERKYIEESLRINEEKLREIFNIMSEGFALNECIFDENGEMIDYRIIEVNQAFYSVADFEVGQVIGNVATKLYGMTKEVINTYWKSHKDKDTVIYSEMISPINRKHFYISTSPIIRNKFVTLFVDNTEQKNMEEMLLESNKFLDTIIDENPYSIWISDENGTLVRINKACCQLLNIDESDVINKYNIFNDNIVEEQGFKSLVKSVFEEGKIAHFEFYYDTSQIKDIYISKTKRIFLDVTIFPIKDLNGKITNTVVQQIDITERKKAESALRESEEKYRTLFENMNEGFSLCEVKYDREGKPSDFRFLDINNSYEQMTCLKATDIIGKTLLDIAPDMEASWIEVLAKVAITREPVRYEDYNVSTKKYYETFIFSPREGNIALLLKDVSDRKRTEIQLKESKAHAETQAKQMNTILENMNEGVFVFDKDGKYIMVNEAGRNTFKFDGLITGDSMKIAKYYYMSGEEIREKEIPGFQVQEGKIVSEMLIRKKQGDSEWYISINGKPILDEQGKFQFGVITCHNVTEQIKQQKIIEFHRKQMETILNSMPDAVFLYDKNKNYLFANKAARETYPHSLFNKIGDSQKAMESYTMEGDRIPLGDMPAFRIINGEIINSYRFASKIEDRTFYFSVSGCPIYNSNEEIEMGLLCFRDITVSVNLENSLREQQKKLLITEMEKNEVLEAEMKLKDEFLYLITHEFKTPIAVINIALQAIDSICKDDVTERLARFINTIKTNTNRQLRLVNNLLDITKITTGNIKISRSNFDIVYVTKAIVKSVEVYAMQKKVNLNFRSSIAKREVYFDEEKFERIMLNLLANALKFTPEGKSIYVFLTVKKYKKQDFISVSVNDEGIGIPADKQKVIFERFGQADTSLSRKAEGTGLGLYLVTLLVNALEGRISLESEMGIGSTFTLLFPAIKPITINKVSANNEHNNQFISEDSRIVQAVSIEFSDLYFD